MRLRNKKTGEILETVRSAMVNKDKFRIYDDLTDKYYTYNSLAELNEDWKDVPEEPAGYWYIDFDSDILGCVEPFDEETDEKRKSIGNYFETEEEAEKAVEKLKAIKRLKDKGFRFSGFSYTELCDYARVNIKATMINDSINEDLELLFGGEE